MGSYSYFDWQKHTHKCECGWSGPASDLDEETFDEVSQSYCPKCGSRMGLVSYPTDSEVRKAAAAGDSAAKEMLNQQIARDSYIDRVEKSRIQNIDGIRDIPDATVHVHLSLDGPTLSTYLVISANGIEIGRELCFFEDPEPASRLLKILEEKFGDRLQSIDWNEATLYLCGDRTSYIRIVSEAFQKYPSSG